MPIESLSASDDAPSIAPFSPPQTRRTAAAEDKRKPRILLVQTQAENAGAQEISRLLGSGLTARGYDVHNLYFFRKSSSFDEPPNTSYGAPGRPGHPLAFLRFLWALGKRIRQIQPDVILTFQHYGNIIGGPVARLVSPAPVVANQVSAQLMMNRLVRAADFAMGNLGVFRFITVNSQKMQREYSRYPQSYRKRLRYVPHGFDRKDRKLSKAAARQQFGLPADAVILGSVARLHPLKHLDAAIRLLAERTDWVLALAGQGMDEPRLRELADQLNVAGRIHFIGEIAPERVGDFLAGLDVFVFPSKAETFGLAAVEAAHAGIPVVANDLSVLREVLSFEGKPAALFVDASDVAKLTAAIASVLEDNALAERLRQNAMGLRKRYSVETMVEDYVRIIDAATTRPSSRRQPAAETAAG